MKPIICKIVLIFSICVSCSLSWPDLIREVHSVCNSFHVTHDTGIKVAASIVTVTMKRAGDVVNCIEPDTLYHVEFRNTAKSGHKIGGILVKQIGSISGKVLIKGYLPVNTVGPICGDNSIAHSCRSKCFLGDNGEWLNITYMSASMKSLQKASNVSFRYTIVLSKHGDFPKHIDNEIITFPVCPIVKYCPNFGLKLGAIKSDTKCGKIRTVKSNETHIFTSNITNINYTCHTKMSVKKTDCHPTCTEDGQELCCKNRIAIMRPRNFTCTAVPELNTGEIADVTITRTANVLQTKLCVCYLCADILCDDDEYVLP